MAIEPDAFVSVHPTDASKIEIETDDWVTVTSRRGEITLQARVRSETQPGSVFVPFHFREAGANTLTTDALDPDAKIPEFKFCAVKLERA